MENIIVDAVGRLRSPIKCPLENHIYHHKSTHEYEFHIQVSSNILITIRLTIPTLPAPVWVNLNWIRAHFERSCSLPGACHHTIFKWEWVGMELMCRSRWKLSGRPSHSSRRRLRPMDKSETYRWVIVIGFRDNGKSGTSVRMSLPVDTSIDTSTLFALYAPVVFCVVRICN